MTLLEHFCSWAEKNVSKNIPKELDPLENLTTRNGGMAVTLRKLQNVPHKKHNVHQVLVRSKLNTGNVSFLAVFTA